MISRTAAPASGPRPASPANIGRSQRDLPSKSVVCPAEGDGDPPWPDPRGPSPPPAPGAGSLVIRDPGGSGGTGDTRYPGRPVPAPGSGGEPEGLRVTPNVVGSGCSDPPARSGLGRAQGRTGLGKDVSFPLCLLVRTHPGAPPGSRGPRPGGARCGGREGTRTTRLCRAAGCRPGPPRWGGGRGLAEPEDDATGLQCLQVHPCCHGDDSILAAWMRPACPQK